MGESEGSRRFQAMVLEGVSQGRFGKSQAVANVARFPASDIASGVSGERTTVDGGFAHT